MNLKRTFSLILTCLVLPIITTSIPASASTSANETVTAESVQLSPAVDKISGYAKDAKGNPLANRTLYVVHFDSFIHSTERNVLIEFDKFREVVTTDSNGYYSCYARESGYFYVFLPSGSISYDKLSDIDRGYAPWPSRFLLKQNKVYTSDTYDSVYVLISTH